MHMTPEVSQQADTWQQEAWNYLLCNEGCWATFYRKHRVFPGTKAPSAPTLSLHSAKGCGEGREHSCCSQDPALGSQSAGCACFRGRAPPSSHIIPQTSPFCCPKEFTNYQPAAFFLPNCSPKPSVGFTSNTQRAEKLFPPFQADFLDGVHPLREAVKTSEGARPAWRQEMFYYSPLHSLGALHHFSLVLLSLLKNFNNQDSD